MIRNTFLLLVLIATNAFSQVQVLSKPNQAQEDKKPTVLEIVVDSSSIDGKIPIELTQYQTHGSAAAYNTSVTFYSNDKVADLPATLSIEPGKYLFLASNGKARRSARISVEADGGYQKWKVTPGNSKKAKLSTVFRYLSYGIAGIGLNLAILGHTMSDIDDSGVGLLVCGYSMLGGGLSVSIPFGRSVKRNRMVAEKIESYDSAPVATLEFESTIQ